MIKFKRIFILFLSYIFLLVNASADTKVAYIDIEYILSNSNPGKNLIKKLNLIENEKKEKFNSEEIKLKEEENKIIASKSIITEEQLKKDINEFQKKIENYKKIKSDEINTLKKNRNSELSKLLDLINPIIKDYMTDNSISMVIDKKNIYIADKNFDITENVIDIINKKIK